MFTYKFRTHISIYELYKNFKWIFQSYLKIRIFDFFFINLKLSKAKFIQQGDGGENITFRTLN